MRKTLTEVAVEKLRPPQKGRVEILDTLVPGLTLRVTEHEVKSWALLYRVAGRGGVGANGLARKGPLQRLTLGRYPLLGLKAARTKARAALELAADGRDPVSVRQDELAAHHKAAGNTVRAVAQKFLELHAMPRNRGWRDTEGVFRNHIFPALGDRPISDVTKEDVLNLLDRLAVGPKPTSATKTFATFRKLCRWSISRGILKKTSPVAGLEQPVKTNPRDRVLNDAELVSLWRTAEKMGYPFGAIVQLLILTGQRRDEIAAARWAWVDMGRATLLVPGEHYKTGRPHLVPLSARVMDIVRGLPRWSDGDYMFSTTAGLRPISGFSRYKRRLDAAMLADLRQDAERRGEDPAKVELTPWRLHDLRRTCTSGIAELQVGEHVIERILGHAKKSVINKHYNWYGYFKEKRKALGKWATHVARLLGEAPSAKVIPI
jgi:integrase